MEALQQLRVQSEAAARRINRRIDLVTAAVVYLDDEEASGGDRMRAQALLTDAARGFGTRAPIARLSFAVAELVATLDKVFTDAAAAIEGKDSLEETIKERDDVIEELREEVKTLKTSLEDRTAEYHTATTERDHARDQHESAERELSRLDALLRTHNIDPAGE